ncbi:MAG TPA: HAMP domain-containing sensor histidine kinase, partial [Gammaproteobacteria bacterium]|nr:HAMP domain-containing sensor histidine kinase [Gammaproteobacteria bacterium]
MSNEAEPKCSVEALRDAIRARDEFLTIAAHELRNPMHALLLQVMAAEREARRVGDGGLIERLERVRLAVERYVERATTLLDVSRINAGRLQLRRDEVDFAQIVRQSIDSHSAEAAFHGSSMHLDAPGTLVGRWDRTSLDQIVSNLLSNALKYGDGRSVEVRLSHDQGAARLEVRDNGIGISPDDQTRIFDPFEQIVTERRFAGFGIGLWLVRSLVEAHGGSIAVSSEPGRGSVFTVLLPLDSD